MTIRGVTSDIGRVIPAAPRPGMTADPTRAAWPRGRSILDSD